jgi:glycosyltransferase involved in cell wall biosynthesis
VLDSAFRRDGLDTPDVGVTLAERPQAVGGLRIACVYHDRSVPDLTVASMNYIRLFRMAEALAGRGHHVDIVIDRRPEPVVTGPRLREIPFRHACWDDYDVIKTFFHDGFAALRAHGGERHPFIVSKLGSVVGRDQTPGVHFYGRVRKWLCAQQDEIAIHSRAVTVLTPASADLWRRTHGPRPDLLLVPTGVDARIPAAGPNPYPSIGIHEPVVIYAGNLYPPDQQPEVSLLWQERLNRVGRALARLGLRLVVAGPGDTRRLDPAAARHVGAVDIERFWDWQRHASVGLVLAQGPVQDNESSKIYYYLRTGLPVVCERPVPNAALVTQTGHGRLVDYEDVTALAEASAELAARPPESRGVVDYMITAHAWEARAALYDPLLARVPRRRPASPPRAARGLRTSSS